MRKEEQKRLNVKIIESKQDVLRQDKEFDKKMDKEFQYVLLLCYVMLCAYLSIFFLNLIEINWNERRLPVRWYQELCRQCMYVCMYLCILKCMYLCIYRFYSHRTSHSHIIHVYIYACLPTYHTYICRCCQPTLPVCHTYIHDSSYITVHI